MKIQIQVKTNARTESVEKLPDGTYRVSVRARPHKGKANDAIIAILSRHFSVPKSTIHIVLGAKSKKKLIVINTG